MSNINLHSIRNRETFIIDNNSLLIHRCRLIAGFVLNKPFFFFKLQEKGEDTKKAKKEENGDGEVEEEEIEEEIEEEEEVDGDGEEDDDDDDIPEGEEDLEEGEGK